MTLHKINDRSKAECGLCRVALIFALVLLAGCVAPKPPPDTDISASLPIVSAPPAPRVVTDLTKLSGASTAALAPSDVPAPPPVNVDRKASRNEELTHQLAADAPATRYDVVRSQLKGGSRLLNDKARQYANFADLLLNQTLKAAQSMASDKLGQRRVPSDLSPTELTAVMDSEGRLKEIIIEQHSGDLVVDKLFIEACKKGIWSRNPPPGARASDGTYRLRVEGIVYNTSYDRYGQYSYDTELGLSIL
jgi:hypothetical protein